MDIRPGDSYQTTIIRFANAFLIHVAKEHQADLVTESNRFTVILGLVAFTMLIAYLEQAILKLDNKEIRLFKDFLSNFFVFVGTFNAYFLISATDFIFIDTAGDAGLTLDNLFRPVMLTLVLSSIIPVIGFLSISPFKSKEKKRDIEARVKDLEKRLKEMNAN